MIINLRISKRAFERLYHTLKDKYWDVEEKQVFDQLKKIKDSVGKTK